MVRVVVFLVIFIVLVGVTAIVYTKKANAVSDIRSYQKITLDSLLTEFKSEVADITKDDGSVLTSDINYEVIARDRKRIKDAVPDAYHGIPAARDVIIGLARNFVEGKFKSKEEILEVVNFEDTNYMEPQWQWEILLFKLGKVYKKNIIRYLQDKYDIAKLKTVNRYEYRNGHEEIVDSYSMREFSAKDLKYIFDMEVSAKRYEDGSILNYNECADLLAIYLESRFIGAEMLDTLEQLSFDGLNFGSSGSIRYRIDGKYNVPYRDTNSLWVQIDACWVLFSFIDFKTVNKMKKIANQLSSYGSTPPMTEKMPAKVIDNYEGSRCVAIRPSAGESWFYSQRNFTLSIYKMKELLDKPYVKNWELVGKLIRFLMLSEQTTAFTGQQNTGKTTLMKSSVEFVEDKNIRVLEKSFELALREIYPHKNTYTVKPTDYISSSALQDLLKKTDGWMSMVGEVAEDIVAARMIQFCLIASAFTIFSHHGKDDAGLINGLTNSLVASGEYKDHAVAMSTVLDAIKNNVHLGFTDNHERVVEYISQIIKEDEVTPYPEIETLLKKAKTALNHDDEYTLKDCLVAYTLLCREHFTRTTDRVHFTSRKIVVYDSEKKMYVPNEWYTPEAMDNICQNLSTSDRQEFIQFYTDNWVNHKYLREEAANAR